MGNTDAKTFTVSLGIQKPVSEVFDAVVNPKKLTGYFISTSTGPLVEGTTVEWMFPEFPDLAPTPVIVKQVVPNELLRLEWEGAANTPTQITMTFKSLGKKDTLVSISESGWHDTDEGRKSELNNATGWMNMLCCMKAYVEHDINLRKGSFDFMKGKLPT